MNMTGENTHIYLDHNATSPLAPCVLEEMNNVWRSTAANPSSQHAPGRQARKWIESAREEVIQILGGSTSSMAADNLLFTSGGTEANNLALTGFSDQYDVLLLSRLEHPSIIAVAEAMASENRHQVRWIKANQNGEIDLDDATSHLKDLAAQEKRVFVTCMLANNETGVVQPVVELAALARKTCGNTGCIIHSDATQAVGKIPVSLRELDVDLISFAGHKFHGPVGVGGLLMRVGLKPRPQLLGGFQQGALRPGTESVAIAVGMAKALNWWSSESAERKIRLTTLRDRLETKLQQQLPELVVNGGQTLRLPHATNISVTGIDRQQLVMALDFAGVACSSGSACASGSSEPSSVLQAMGLPKPIIDAAIRLSVGAFTTEAEIDEAVEKIVACVKRLRGR
jgi:cysteine desulfurase